jgi:hypothetical protein
MREAAFQNAPAGVFTKSEREPFRFRRPIVELASFAPQAEFSGADVSPDAFGGCANTGQLEIVNRARAVHRDVIDEAALHQIDYVPVDAGSNNVPTDDHCARRALRLSGSQPRRDLGQVGMLEIRRGII